MQNVGRSPCRTSHIPHGFDLLFLICFPSTSLFGCQTLNFLFIIAVHIQKLKKKSIELNLYLLFELSPRGLCHCVIVSLSNINQFHLESINSQLISTPNCCPQWGFSKEFLHFSTMSVMTVMKLSDMIHIAILQIRSKFQVDSSRFSSGTCQKSLNIQAKVRK